MKNFKLDINKDSKELDGLTISEAFQKIENGEVDVTVITPLTYFQLKATEIDPK